MCYGGGFLGRATSSAVGAAGTSDSDPDNPNAFPYYDIPGGMANSSGYANAAFHAARQDPNGYPAKHCEPSWADQTNWAVTWANEAIEDSNLRSKIDAEVEMLSNVEPPSLVGFSKADISSVGQDVKLGGNTLSFSTDTGAITGFVDQRNVSWASVDHQLALFEYTLYTNDQMAALRTEYCPSGCNPKEFGKPGMPLNASVNATPFAPSIWLKKEVSGEVSEVITIASMRKELNVEYGAPSQVWLHLTAAGGSLSVDVTLVNKTATRFAEAAFITFDPVPGNGDGQGWAMDKLGRWVSPLAVADGGSMGLSPVNTGILYSKGSSSNTLSPRRSDPSMFFRTFDAAVVKFGDKTPFPTPIHGSADMSRGTHFLLWDNCWNTNYVFWWPYETKPGYNSDNVLFRFSIEMQD
jgi:hypothetical protein